MRASLLSLGVLVFALGGAGTASAGPARVALLPIAVHSAEPDAAYVSSGLAAMLSARLERSGKIAVLRLRGAPVAGDEAEAVQAAQGSGADFVVFGSFTQFGQGASFDVRCASLGAGGAAAGPARQVFIHAGSIGEIIPRLDELAEKLARYVEGGGVPVAEPANGSSAAGALGDLQRRVEALEQAVYLGGAAAAPGQGAEGEAGTPPSAEGGDGAVR